VAGNFSLHHRVQNGPAFDWKENISLHSRYSDGDSNQTPPKCQKSCYCAILFCRLKEDKADAVRCCLLPFNFL